MEQVNYFISSQPGLHRRFISVYSVLDLKNHAFKEMVLSVPSWLAKSGLLFYETAEKGTISTYNAYLLMKLSMAQKDGKSLFFVLFVYHQLTPENYRGTYMDILQALSLFANLMYRIRISN